MTIETQATDSRRVWRADGNHQLVTPPTWGVLQSAYLRVKFVLEFVVALALLALVSPLIGLAALLVKLTSPGPVFYTQTRLGRNGRPYTIYKIRTMVHNCECNSGARWSTPGDPRVTLIGRFLRRTHLDELPQLWNVLRGEMSLVGPRPERPEFVPQLEQAVPHYRDRLRVRPGLTGMAQVVLPPDTDLASVRRKLAYDLYYVRQVSPWLDLRILLCTAFYLMGGPLFRLVRAALLPKKEVVEQSYQRAVLQAGAVPQMQPI
jgi:lipopolysaccharide/colanic/teichoic acid biosynthesis glycosyltransferase